MKKLLTVILVLTLLIGFLVGCLGNNGSDTSPLPTQKVYPTGNNSSDASFLPVMYSNNIGSNVVEANSKFAFDILKAIYFSENTENLFLSPTSISTALAMTMNGAKGKTFEEMEKALHFNEIEMADINSGFAYIVKMLNRKSDGISISFANSLWLREGSKVLESFKSVNSDYYAAVIKELDFSSNQAKNIINNWVSDRTNGLIKSIIDNNISPETVILLINTIYFKGVWKAPFNANITYETDFKLDDVTIGIVDMMSKKANVLYFDKGDYKIISLPYRGERIVMDFILPKEGTAMRDFMSNFDYSDYMIALAGLSQEDDVKIGIPKFEAEYETSLIKPLALLGMEKAFTVLSELSGISESENLLINEVKHKTYIRVDEEGTVASAVTKVGGLPTAKYNKNPLEFIADRPFQYMIRDTTDGTILFTGIFDTPTTSTLTPALTPTPTPTPTQYNNLLMPLPQNGYYKIYSGNEAIAPFSIKTPNEGEYYFILLKDYYSMNKTITLFVHPGKEVEIDVPLGDYMLFYAFGTDWHGEEYLFGPDTSYFKSNDKLTFYISGDYVMGMSIELIKQSSDNLPTEDINKSEFFD